MPAREKVRRPREEVQPFTDLLAEQMPPGFRWLLGGSWRRGAPLVGDLDVLVFTRGGTFDGFRFPANFQVERRGPQIASGRFYLAGEPGLLRAQPGDSIQVDFWAVIPEQAGAFLMFVTGPAQLNIAQREVARRKGYTLSQYGLTAPGRGVIPAATEREVYDILGLDWIEPGDRQRFAPVAPATGAKTQSWTVQGSKDRYTVTRIGSSWRCERADGSGLCLGFKFSREHPATCRHIRQVKEELHAQALD